MVLLYSEFYYILYVWDISSVTANPSLLTCQPMLLQNEIKFIIWSCWLVRRYHATDIPTHQHTMFAAKRIAMIVGKPIWDPSVCISDTEIRPDCQWGAALDEYQTASAGSGPESSLAPDRTMQCVAECHVNLARRQIFIVINRCSNTVGRKGSESGLLCQRDTAANSQPSSLKRQPWDSTPKCSPHHCPY